MKVPFDPYNILLAGVGGQGIVTVSKILAAAAWKAGFKTSLGEAYGLSQRGGSVVSHLRISSHMEPPPLTPDYSTHVLVGLEPAEALRSVKIYGNSDTVVIVNPELVPTLEARAGKVDFPDSIELLETLRALVNTVIEVPAKRLSNRPNQTVLQNSVMLGALCGAALFPAAIDGVKKVMPDYLKAGKILDANLEAFDAGHDYLANMKSTILAEQYA